jgi:hypothetical protein
MQPPESQPASAETEKAGILSYSHRPSEYQQKWWHGSWFDWLGSMGLVLLFGMIVTMIVMLAQFASELIRR